MEELGQETDSLNESDRRVTLCGMRRYSKTHMSYLKSRFSDSQVSGHFTDGQEDDARDSRYMTWVAIRSVADVLQNCLDLRHDVQVWNGGNTKIRPELKCYAQVT